MTCNIYTAIHVCLKKNYLKNIGYSNFLRHLPYWCAFLLQIRSGDVQCIIMANDGPSNEWTAFLPPCPLHGPNAALSCHGRLCIAKQNHGTHTLAHTLLLHRHYHDRISICTGQQLPVFSESFPVQVLDLWPEQNLRVFQMSALTGGWSLPRWLMHRKQVWPPPAVSKKQCC